MDNKEILDKNIERVGWGLLAILWGATILFDFIPFSVGLIGTGLIMLGANAVRRLNQLPTNNSVWGILILAWGGLDGHTLYLTARDCLYRLPLLAEGARR